MKTEFEKMRSGEMYSFKDPVIAGDIKRANMLCCRLNRYSSFDPEYREIIEQLVPGLPESSVITPPFHCDHGNGVIVGEHVFVNYGCVMLDGAYIRLGDNVKVGPNCQFYTPFHPENYMERRKTQETSLPITVGEDTWLGGGVIICPGVTIGKRCIIGAGSVVVHDIPDDCVAVGNPCEVKRKL